MFEMNQTDNMIQNMLDAGCSKEDVTCFCECRKKQSKQEELDILEKHREELLCDIHQIQHKIEMLDEQISALQGDSDRSF